MPHVSVSVLVTELPCMHAYIATAMMYPNQVHYCYSYNNVAGLSCMAIQQMY